MDRERKKTYITYIENISTISTYCIHAQIYCIYVRFIFYIYIYIIFFHLIVWLHDKGNKVATAQYPLRYDDSLSACRILSITLGVTKKKVCSIFVWLVLCAMCVSYAICVRIYYIYTRMCVAQRNIIEGVNFTWNCT